MAELDGLELSAPLIQRETGPISLNLLSPQGVTTQGARQGAFETHKRLSKKREPPVRIRSASHCELLAARTTRQARSRTCQRSRRSRQTVPHHHVQTLSRLEERFIAERPGHDRPPPGGIDR
jgi:hypothetical protein